MKVLIVDDVNEKALEVKSICMGKEILGEENITIVPSIIDAVEQLKNEKYQLMITDLCLPQVYGNPLVDSGGLDLIKYLNRDDRVFAPDEIIVLSSYQDIVQKYSADIEKQSFEAIYYDNSSEEWKTKIQDKIRYLVRCEKSPKEMRKNIYDVAILTAVDVEKEAVFDLAETWNKVKIPGDSTVYYETEWRNDKNTIRVITSSLTQMGMVAAATATSKIIYNFAPKYIIMPGIAGGVREEYNLGDIIIPREVKDYCSGKYTTPKGIKEENVQNPFEYFVPTSASLHTDFDIINIASDSHEEQLQKIYNKWKNRSKYCPPKIRTGYMATGDSVIQNSRIINLMIKNHLRQADGVDMEAYGMYYAAQQAINPKPISICMKAISDFANKEKSDEHQAYAAYVSAEFAKVFVLECLFC